MPSPRKQLDAESPKVPFGNDDNRYVHSPKAPQEVKSRVGKVKGELQQVIDDFEKQAKKPKGNFFQRFGLVFSSCINFFPKPLRYLMSFILGAAPLALMLIPGVNLLVAAIVGSIFSAFAWGSLASVTEIQGIYKDIIMNEIARLRVLQGMIERLEDIVIKLEKIRNDFEQQIKDLSAQNKDLGNQVSELESIQQRLNVNTIDLRDQINKMGGSNKFLEKQVKILQLMTKQFVDQFPDPKKQAAFMNKLDDIIQDKASIGSILGDLEKLEEELSAVAEENHEMVGQLSEIITSLQNLKQHEARNQYMRQTLAHPDLSNKEKIIEFEKLLRTRDFDKKVSVLPTSPTVAKREQAAKVFLLWGQVQKERADKNPSWNITCENKTDKLSNKPLINFQDVCAGRSNPQDYCVQIKMN